MKLAQHRKENISKQLFFATFAIPLRPLRFKILLFHRGQAK